MHTEHLRNVRIGTLLLSWFIAAAVVSLVVIAMIAVGLLNREGSGGLAWGLLATAIGFAAGGYFAGWRAGAAPILYAVGMGLVSLVIWLLLNLVPGELLGAESWSVGGAYTAGLVLLQIVAAAIGGRLASRDARAASARSS